MYLCRFKKDGQFYAMKVIDKDVIVKNKKKNIIMNERNIMQSSKHPFLIEMKFSFETAKYLIFVVEYCPGGELFGLIKKYKRLSEEVSRFYIIEIFLGLSYLHQNNVVYRDIKPENILLGQDGHVKVADLGLAKPDMFEGELAYSFCGSPEYMSPEMILQYAFPYPESATPTQLTSTAWEPCSMSCSSDCLPSIAGTPTRSTRQCSPRNWTSQPKCLSLPSANPC